MLGIALGVAALIIVLSVMNGFQKEIRSRILGITPHIQVTSDNGQLAEWSDIQNIVTQHREVRAASPYVNGQGMISLSDSVQGVMVRGILPEGEEQLIGLSKK